MDKILHDPKDPKLWELWYIPYNGSCRILSINRYMPFDFGSMVWGRVSFIASDHLPFKVPIYGRYHIPSVQLLRAPTLHEP